MKAKKFTNEQMKLLAEAMVGPIKFALKMQKEGRYLRLDEDYLSGEPVQLNPHEYSKLCAGKDGL